MASASSLRAISSLHFLQLHQVSSFIFSSSETVGLQSGESKPDLGYLLEASEDELGLPPSENFSEEAATDGVNELVRVPSDSSGADEFLQYDDPANFSSGETKSDQQPFVELSAPVSPSSQVFTGELIAPFVNSETEFKMLQYKLHGSIRIIDDCSFKVSDFNMLHSSDVH